MWENIEQIKNIIKISINKTDVLNKLGLKNNGGNFNTLSRFISNNSIDISHFDYKKSTKSNTISSAKLKISEILVKNSTYSNTSSLKRRLYKEGLKFKICELCGQDENWKGNKMSLIIDHINGHSDDNRIENLRIVCPNCNATLDTHCRGHRINNGINRHDICDCGEPKKKSSKMCKKCYFINGRVKKENTKAIRQRKITRPSYAQLIQEIETLGYVGTGKLYNVSDNSIRKWKKMYEKYGENF